MNKVITLLVFIGLLFGCKTPSSPTSIVPPKTSGTNGSLVCGCGADCTSSAGDGIPDNWKTIGIDSNCDGIIDLDLEALGANPHHKDVFLQIDYMAMSPEVLAFDSTATFKPSATGIHNIVQAFENAPVTNPDGTTGIHLHVFIGKEVPFHSVVTLDPQATTACAGPDHIYLGDIKAQSMDPNRALIFHYALSANDSTTPESGVLVSACAVDPMCGGRPSAGSTGVSEIGGTDFIISFGAYWNSQTIDDPNNPVPHNHDYIDLPMAATIMHELGHNFGLMHGGLAEPGNRANECMNYKPNYLSVMNYTYQINGGILTHSNGPIVDSWGYHWKLDYSREQLPTLLESSLNESAGVGSSDPDLEILYWDMSGNEYIGESSGSVDWNNNGIIDSGLVSADINHDGSTGDTILGGEDWSHLNYGFYSNANHPVFSKKTTANLLIKNTKNVVYSE